MFSEREISYTDNERIGNFCFKAEGLARSELSLWTFVGGLSIISRFCLPVSLIRFVHRMVGSDDGLCRKDSWSRLRPQQPQRDRWTESLRGQ